MKIDNIILIEPKNTHNYYPFSIMHPIWEIRCGCLKLFEKAAKLNPKSNISFIGRELHTISFINRFQLDNSFNFSGNALLINSRNITDKSFFDFIEANIRENFSTVFKSDNTIDALFINQTEYEKLNDISLIDIVTNGNISYFQQLTGITSQNFIKINYLWDAIFNNRKQIEADAKLMYDEFTKKDSEHYPGVYITNPSITLINPTVQISPGVVIDACEGIVIIDENVKIMPNAVIIGPVYIGKNSTIKIGAKIYQDTSIGETCKVGGEIENTIFHSNSNKQHDGFLGHSYICEWVNLGADTNNSDLKNTYGSIDMKLEDEIIDTGRMFLGLLCGDHTKSGINSMFNTGTACGISSILVEQWFLPKFIPSFSFGGGKQSRSYNINKAIETANIVMQRRGKSLIPEEIELMKNEFEHVMEKFYKRG